MNNGIWSLDSAHFKKRPSASNLYTSGKLAAWTSLKKSPVHRAFGGNLSEIKVMGNPTPFSLRIFVADGDPDGLRLVERSNWIGKAVMFPRALYPQVRNRSEFHQTGVYLLVGPRPQGDGETIYIGEGDPVRPRLENHYANKDFWTRAVFFVAGPGQLNKAHVQYLEAQLISRATA